MHQYRRARSPDETQREALRPCSGGHIRGWIPALRSGTSRRTASGTRSSGLMISTNPVTTAICRSRFVAVLRMDKQARSRDMVLSEVSIFVCSPIEKRAHATLKRGRGEGRVHAAPAVSCAFDALENAHTSIQVQRKHSGLPCAMALRLIRALPGGHAVPPSPARCEASSPT